MYQFKSLADLARIPQHYPCRDYVCDLVRRLVEGPHGYNPANDGYVVLIEPADLRSQQLLPQLPFPLADMPWEGVVYEPGFFHAVALTNNQFAIDFIIPDEEWLPDTLRISLQNHLTQL